MHKYITNLRTFKPFRFLKSLGFYRRARNNLFFYNFKKILKTRCFSCNPNAITEVHTLTCHAHLFMYISAIKSLLRFYDDLAIVIHDDGSLTEEDIVLLRKHIRGIRVIDKDFADREVNHFLSPYPKCKKYRNVEPVSSQLLDISFLSKSGKVAGIDSDTLFLQRPTRFIDWAKNNTKEIIYLYETNPNNQREFLAKFNCDYSPHLCVGLLCYYNEIVSLSLVEDLLGKVSVSDPFYHWFNQNVFPFLLSMQDKYQVYPFSKDEYQGADTIKNGAVFRHYWGSIVQAYSRKYIYIDDLKKVITEIGR